MSISTLTESDKSSIIIFYNGEDKVKKLEEIFDSIKYISPAPYEYNIIIEDKKINSLSLNRFNIMSSLHYLFISFNTILPIFRVNVDKLINIEFFDKIVEDNKLIIKIKEVEPLKAFNDKRRNIFLKSFFNKVLGRVYNKYKYYNAKIHYINNLKKKCINYLKYYYLYALREKQKDNIMKKYYYKQFIFLLKNINKKNRENKSI